MTNTKTTKWPEASNGASIDAPETDGRASATKLVGLTSTTPEDMTIAELQAEIGRLQSILFRKVAGDPTIGVSPQIETTTLPLYPITTNMPPEAKW